MWRLDSLTRRLTCHGGYRYFPVILFVREKSSGNTMGVYLMGEFTGLNVLMLSDSPYDIHNLCGDYTETTIICHFLQKRYGYYPSIYIIQNLNIKRND